MKAKTKMYRTDEREKIVRRRAFETLVIFEHAEGFDNFTAGYVQALKDMGVEKKYITIFNRVCTRLRMSYKPGNPNYLD